VLIRTGGRLSLEGMEVYVNGEKRELADAPSVGELLEGLGFVNQRLAVEVNEEIIPRSQYTAHYLKAGDRVEIVRAIGGG